MVQKDDNHFKGWRLIDQTKSWSNEDFFQWPESGKLLGSSLKFVVFSCKTVTKEG